MANTLTALAPALYSDGRIVPRERVGFIQSVTTDFNDQQAAKGDTVKITVAPTMSSGTFTPAQTFAAGTDSTPTTLSLTLNQMKEISWNLTAEQERSLMNSGVAQDFAVQRVKQAIRTACNEIEAYIGTIADTTASRAFGTAATTPFGTANDLSDSAGVYKILMDNGASMDELALVLNTTAGANVRGKQSSLFKANEAGGSDLLRRGIIGQVHGFDFRESAGIVSHTAGTGTSYVIDGTGNTAVGSTVLKLKTGSGTILAGDVITIGSFKYVVTVALSGALLTIQEPGLMAVVADGNTVTVSATHASNIALHKSAIALVARPALQPVSAAVEQMVVTDEVSGLSFLLVRNVGSGMSSWYLRWVYDAFAANPYAMAKLLG